MQKLPKKIIKTLDFKLANRRILKDIMTDFIYAPHYNIIYKYAQEDLIEMLKSDLQSSSYQPSLPISMEIPKANGFTRPGSILNPFDRLFYQSIIDQIAPDAEKLIDRSKVFSYELLADVEEGFMFKPSHESYSRYQDQIIKIINTRGNNFVLVSDVAAFFELLYQHNLINLLNAAGCNVHLVNALDGLLSSFSGKNSYGIVQGVFPSDFLGNFYLCSLDAEQELEGVEFVRYVDDMITFFDTEIDAKRHQINLCRILRKEGLSLNESKSYIKESLHYIGEESAVDLMFQNAWMEVSINFDRDDFYQAIFPWDVEDEILEGDDEKEVEATRTLFHNFDVYPSVRDKIDKFCLPILATANDDSAVDYVLNNFSSKPHLCQPYIRYLSQFLNDNSKVLPSLTTILSDKSIVFPNQYMWIYASLMNINKVDSNVVDISLNHLRNFTFPHTLRALAAIFVGKWGNAKQKRVLKHQYEEEPSEYVKSAMLFSAQYFPYKEKDTCFRSWGSSSKINSLIVKALRKM